MITKKQVKKTFLDLVSIDSPSGREKKVGDYIIRYLRELGIVARRDQYGNVIAKVKGEGKPLMLNAHMDTVEPGCGIKAVVNGDVIKSDGTTVLGADNKAALTAILEAVSYFRKEGIAHRSLELVFTREEEMNFLGAKNLDYRKIKSKEAIVMDALHPLGRIIITTPYIYVMNIGVRGKASHAGSFPEKGINAIFIAAKAMAELKIGRINKSTVNNIGIINGGTAMNTVPEEVNIVAEARSYILESVQNQIDLFNKAFKKYVRRYKGRLSFKVHLDCAGFRYSKNDSFIKKIAEANANLKIKTSYEKTGGVSDANVFVTKGIKAVNISCGGKNPHTTRESIKVSELQKLTEFLVEFCGV